MSDINTIGVGEAKIALLVDFPLKTAKKFNFSIYCSGRTASTECASY